MRIALLLLAILVLGAMANTVHRRRVARRSSVRQEAAAGGEKPHSPKPEEGPVEEEPAAGGEEHPEGGEEEPEEGGEEHPEGGEGGEEHPEGGEEPAPEGGEGEEHPEKPKGGKGEYKPPQKIEALGDKLKEVCKKIGEGCKESKKEAKHDGKATDLCDKDICELFLPNNLCFFPCAQNCSTIKGPDSKKEACADNCMKCASHPPPPPTKGEIPLFCNVLAKGCKAQKKESKHDGTIYDLCDEKDCKKFLPAHKCFWNCTFACDNSATGDAAVDDACVSKCMKCQDPVANKTKPAAGGEGGEEGPAEEHPEGEEEPEEEEAPEVEAGGEAEPSAEVTAARIVRLMRRSQPAVPFRKTLSRARVETRRRSPVQRRKTVRRQAVRRSSVQRRHAPIRKP